MENDRDDAGPDAPLLPNPSPPPAPSSPLLARALPFMAFHFLLASSELLLTAPLLSLFQRSICLAHFAAVGDPSTPSSTATTTVVAAAIDEARCRLVPAVQRELALVRGWRAALDTLPVFLVAVPVGRMADRWGRRRVLLGNLMGVGAAVGWVLVVCAFPKVLPIRLVWGSSLLLLCGGGLYTTAALMWAMASAAFEEKERSKAFYYIFSAFYAAELVSSALASATMETSPWIGCFLAMCSILGAMALVPVMPSSKARAGTEAGNENQGSSEGSVAAAKGASTFREALSNRNVLLALPVFLVGALRYTVLNVLMQYASVRFGWPISKTALLYTETAVVTMALFMFLVPNITTLLRTRFKYEAATLDLGMVRASVALLCAGSVCIAVSRSSEAIFLSVLVFAAGFGSRVSMLSLISYWTSEEAKGGFYAAIAVLENIGHAVGDPSLQHIYAAVLDRNDALQSLPFFVAAVLYGMATVSAMTMTLKSTGSNRMHLA